MQMVAALARQRKAKANIRGKPICVCRWAYLVNTRGFYRVSETVEHKWDLTKQDRYKNGKKDLIDRWAEEKTPVEFRAIMIAQMEKYQRRYGKKDDFQLESYKLCDYANRLHEYEKNIASNPNFYTEE